jgi:hypothetical protein
MDFMLANPTVPLGEVAIIFDVTPAWLSVVIHSDMFQMQLREKQDKCFERTVLPIREKLNFIAHKALDNLAEKVEHKLLAPDEERKTTELVLKSLGYGTTKVQVQGPVTNTTNNTTIVAADSDLIARARSRIGRPALIEGEPIPDAVEEETLPSRTPKELSAPPECGMGEVVANPTPLREEAGTETGQPLGGDQVREESTPALFRDLWG